MKLKFLGDFNELKRSVDECISGGMYGLWTELPNGHKQYTTDDGGILNWAPSTGSIWFQGKKTAIVELEQRFKVAAKGRITSQCGNARKTVNDDVSTLKELLADALLENEKLRRRGAG
jgi:hypothetical protein